MEELPDYMKKILFRQFKGEPAKVDSSIIKDWIRRHPAQKQEIEELTATWQLSNELLQEPEFDAAAAWIKLDRRIAIETEKKNDTTRPVFRITTIAKVMVAAIVAGLIIAGWWMHRHRQDALTTVAALTDQHLSLPDGTAVWLRKGATIRFPGVFSTRERKILLTGEAFFDVKPADKQPFRIETGKGLIEVLGTSFLVNAGSQQERVAVVTGKVLFAAKDHPQQQCILTANEEAVFTGAAFERKTFTDHRLPWETDELNFQETSLKQVTESLTIYYDSPVKIDTTLASGIERLTITGSFKNQTLSQVLEEITKLTGTHYRNHQDTIILY
jgi:ferric-dicitrate binding protein FerR (iron transport regulator)